MTNATDTTPLQELDERLAELIKLEDGERAGAIAKEVEAAAGDPAKIALLYGAGADDEAIAEFARDILTATPYPDRLAAIATLEDGDPIEEAIGIEQALLIINVPLEERITAIAEMEDEEPRNVAVEIEQEIIKDDPTEFPKYVAYIGTADSVPLAQALVNVLITDDELGTIYGGSEAETGPNCDLTRAIISTLLDAEPDIAEVLAAGLKEFANSEFIGKGVAVEAYSEAAEVLEREDLTGDTRKNLNEFRSTVKTDYMTLIEEAEEAATATEQPEGPAAIVEEPAEEAPAEETPAGA